MHRFTRKRRWAGLSAVILAATATAYSQSDQSTFRSDTRLVVLHASVADSRGHLLTTLHKEQFKVLENGVEQPIRTFRREDVPVSLAVLVDNSGSMRDKRAQVEAAALEAIKVSNPLDEVTIVNFNDEAWHDVTFTSDMKKLEEGITRIDSRGGTAMRDAIDGTLPYIRKEAKHLKKVMLVITDGNDTTSNITLERLVQKAHQSEVLFYMVGLLSEEDKREAKKAKRSLDALAQATGGVAVYPKDLASVREATVEIAKEIRNQYIIAYSPLNQNLDGSFRSVKVTAQAKGNPVVRTRTGYYATPDQQAPKGASSATTLQPSSAASFAATNP